jgi:hypothetical protein
MINNHHKGIAKYDYKLERKVRKFKNLAPLTLKPKKPMTIKIKNHQRTNHFKVGSSSLYTNVKGTRDQGNVNE